MDSEKQTTGVMYSGYLASDLPTAPAAAATPPKKRMAQVPSVGRVVHYVSADGRKDFAAMVVAVRDPGNPFSKVDLTVYADNFTSYVFDIPYKALNPNARFVKTWHWPPFVPPVEVDDEIQN